MIQNYQNMSPTKIQLKTRKKKNHDSHIYYTLRYLGVFITT